jgi:hypothetical protein
MSARSYAPIPPVRCATQLGVLLAWSEMNPKSGGFDFSYRHLLPGEESVIVSSSHPFMRRTGRKTVIQRTHFAGGGDVTKKPKSGRGTRKQVNLPHVTSTRM